MEQAQPEERHGAHAEQELGLHQCSYHPDVQTGLGCGRCGRYICPKCMIQTPVGARCQECARVVKHPTYDVKTSYYLRAALAGGVVAVVGGVIWGLVASTVPFTAWLLGIGVGYLIGETVSATSNRKRGTGLAVVAGVCMVLAGLASGFILNLFGLLVVALGGYIAVNRVK